MNTYLAKLVFNIVIENSNHATQFDEQIRLIEAKSLEEAFFKARSIGKQEDGTFMNSKNDEVNWKFIDVTELYALKDAKDGDQLYASTHETDDSASFIQYTRQKSILIQTNFLTFA